mmetsp:Transcript_47141/g.121828  ORF Transcript_47141/g.121828 Transcript_47141/m.121828 type:complete len:294 (+) Transcript_47141:2327-3208(+)
MSLCLIGKFLLLVLKHFLQLFKFLQPLLKEGIKLFNARILLLNLCGHLFVRFNGHVHSVLCSCRLQLIFEPLYLLCVLLYHSALRHHLVHLRPVLDVLRPVGVVESGEGLFDRAGKGPDGCDDARHCPASQRVLKEAGELAFSVWDVRLMIDESCNDSTESEEGGVDHTSLLLSLIYCPTLSHIFRPSQIDEVELAKFYQVLPIRSGLFCVDSDGEDGMRPAGKLVHQCLGRPSLCLRCVEKAEHLLHVRHDFFFQICDDDALFHALSRGVVIKYAQLFIGLFRKEVSQLLVV